MIFSGMLTFVGYICKDKQPPRGLTEEMESRLTFFTPTGLLKIIQTLIILIRMVP